MTLLDENYRDGKNQNSDPEIPKQEREFLHMATIGEILQRPYFQEILGRSRKNRNLSEPSER